jgi:hypothetical protein
VPVDDAPEALVPEALVPEPVPDDPPNDDPDDVPPVDEPGLPGVLPVEPGFVGLAGVGDVVGVDPPGVVDGVDDGDVVDVEVPLGAVVCGVVVVDSDGDGDVGVGLDEPPPTNPPSDVVAPAGVEPPTIADNGFLARASTTVTTPIDTTNTTTVARAMLRHRSDRATLSVAGHSPSIQARTSRPLAPPGGGGGGGEVGG